jgi:hypothetical protein
VYLIYSNLSNEDLSFTVNNLSDCHVEASKETSSRHFKLQLDQHEFNLQPILVNGLPLLVSSE